MEQLWSTVHSTVVKHIIDTSLQKTALKFQGISGTSLVVDFFLVSYYSK